MRGIDLKKIAEKMNGASGAELKVCFTLDEWALMSWLWMLFTSPLTEPWLVVSN